MNEVRYCPYCGSNAIIIDKHRGFYICLDCNESFDITEVVY
jgi:DNA-directed RNA polymerase subunit RPC12/RpoP